MNSVPRVRLPVAASESFLTVLFAAYLQMDEFFAAVESAVKATKLAPAWPEGFLTLARAQINFGELDLGLETLKRAITLPAEDTEVKREIHEEFERVIALVEQKSKIEQASLGGRIVRGQFVSKSERMLHESGEHEKARS